MIERFFGLLRKRQKLDTDLNQHTEEDLIVDRTKLELDKSDNLPNKCGVSPASTTCWQEEMEIDAPQENNNLNPLCSSYKDHYTMGSESAGSSTGWMHKPDDCQAEIDDRDTIDRPLELNERFVNVLDQLDRRVEKFRKDALGLQEKRDFLLMSIDLIRNNDVLQGMSEHEKEEIGCYIRRLNTRLSTVELNVRTVRDSAQEESLTQVNAFIDSLITSGDAGISRQKCQSYLNACSTSDMSFSHQSDSQHQSFLDKNFENALLGCTLDDQKNIKKRLQGLSAYLNKQIISD